MDAGIEQECAEQVENPFELLYQCRADEDHDGAQDDGAEYAIEQDAVLEFGFDFEIAENHQENEDVVDGKGFFEHIAGEEFEDFFFGDNGPVSRVARQFEIEPASKRAGYGYPNAAPSEGFFNADFVDTVFFFSDTISMAIMIKTAIKKMPYNIGEPTDGYWVINNPCVWGMGKVYQDR